MTKTRLAVSLLSGSALLALATPAFAQSEPAAGDDTEAAAPDIVVTGSSIRGVPPTGSQLIQMGAEDVVSSGAATTQELLANVPQLGTFNQAPRPDPHSNGILSTAPNIRGIGQAQTLVLVNSHRLVGTGHLQNIADPSIVPPSMIQRVEIVADGASSVYGSDGIAGVVNVITRRDYEGAAASFRVGYGDGYNLLNTNVVTGAKWDGGGIVGSVEYSRNSRLAGSARDYVRSNFAPFGGQDNRSLNTCPTAVYKVNNAAGAPTGDFIQYGTGARNARCENAQFTDLYPRQDRLSFFAAGHQDITPDIEFYFDAFHSTTHSDANLAPAGASGTMTRTGNPYFPAADVPAGVDSITAYYSASHLDGVRLRDVQAVNVYGGTAGVDVSLNRFKWTTYWTGSHSTTDLHEGSFSPVVNAASINSTSPALAIDPFTGKTSAATKVGLADYEQFFGSTQWLWEINSKIDGPLFTLPGGETKIAVGGVYRREFYDGKNTLSRIGFEENLGRQIGRREVYSAFGELYVPIFGSDNAMGGFQRLDLSLSGRYDHYNDFGDTFNPKVGINWAPVEGFTLRGSYGTSFHAPALPDLYGPDTRAGYGTGGQNPPGTINTRTGNIFIAGGNPKLDAERATTWSIGMDIAPTWLSGFRASATYYNVHFTGRIAFPTAFGNFFYVLPEMNKYFVDNVTCPGGVAYKPGTTTGCTSNPIDPNVLYGMIKDLRLQNFPRPVNSAADIPPVYIITDLRRVNLSQIDTGGIDFDISYRWRTAGTAMGVQLQGNRVINYDQVAVPGAPTINQFDFGQQKFKARAQYTIAAGPISGALTFNYNDKYKAQFVAVSSAGVTSNQVETIGSFATVDLHIGYKLPEVSVLAGTELTLDVDNAFNQEPPFARAANGYGNGSVLGRVVTVGLRKKF
jgi:iron complex outermembrane receptor protein